MNITKTILRLALTAAVMLGMPMMAEAQTVGPKGTTERVAGMPIHYGDQPPTLSGTYLLKPITIVADKMGAGSEMGDMSGIVMKFDKQQGGTIDAKFYFVGEDGAGEVVGTTSLIQGSDGEFSITVPVRRQLGRRLPIIKLLT